MEEQTPSDSIGWPGTCPRTQGVSPSGSCQARTSASTPEMEEKISSFRNPEKYLSQRIENEIRETDQKYRLFVK